MPVDVRIKHFKYADRRLEALAPGCGSVRFAFNIGLLSGKYRVAIRHLELWAGVDKLLAP